MKKYNKKDNGKRQLQIIVGVACRLQFKYQAGVDSWDDEKVTELNRLCKLGKVVGKDFLHLKNIAVDLRKSGFLGGLHNRHNNSPSLETMITVLDNIANSLEVVGYRDTKNENQTSS